MSTCASSSKTRKNWRFNPYEISICGTSGSGKTTLLEKLIATFSESRLIGCVKHAGHGFSADREGSDSARLRAAGARPMRVIGPTAMAHFGPAPERFDAAPDLLASDLVFVEGYKQANFAKIAFAADADECSNIIATVGPGGDFDRDDVSGIAGAIERHLQSQIAELPLHGLVLSGGRSVRMGEDKGALEIHGKSQIQHSFDLLSPLCDEVHVSCRAEQADDPEKRDLPLLPDAILNAGPLGGIITALRSSHAAWLVLGCDLPLVTEHTLAELVAARDPLRFASSFASSYDGFPEPVCAIYEPKALHRLLHFYAQGYSCPRKALINSRIALRTPQVRDALNNVNTPEELAAVRGNLRSEAF
ncbi:MAG: molybdopterin-guanine dinucleotide biosynthesis protein A [Rhodothermales bacterium]|jgi:molybdopterin-guanine dinucleotide biosynthesis protein A